MARFNKGFYSLAVALVICFVGGFMVSGCNAGGGSSGGTEVYKVVASGQTVAEDEKALNEYAKQDWKLRAVSSSNLYLAR